MHTLSLSHHPAAHYPQSEMPAAQIADVGAVFDPLRGAIEIIQVSFLSRKKKPVLYIHDSRETYHGIQISCQFFHLDTFDVSFTSELYVQFHAMCVLEELFFIISTNCATVSPKYYTYSYVLTFET